LALLQMNSGYHQSVKDLLHRGRNDDSGERVRSVLPGAYTGV
jgi:hypothetical protein